MAVKLESSYALSDDPITLTVTIGDGQFGTSSVKLDDKSITISDNIKDQAIGDGAALAGKILTVKSIVTDIRDETNHTSVTYTLKGGAVEQKNLLEATVADNGDSIIYRASFTLIK